MRTNQVVMVRPAAFGYNEKTAGSNVFQNDIEFDQTEIIDEFDRSVLALEECGIDVLVIEDTPSPVKPDAIFANNWLRLRSDGTVVLFPMESLNRRIERRPEIIQKIASGYACRRLLDLSSKEKEGVFLEGTGSIVFDHYNKVGYVCLSSRTNRNLAESYIKSIDYTPMVFSASSGGKEVYHTNVVLSVAEEFIVVCMEALDEVGKQIFNTSNKSILSISIDQMHNFAGNGLELADTKGESLFVLSERASRSLRSDQLRMIENYSSMCVLPLDKIERVGGGSARCMIAENFLPSK